MLRLTADNPELPRYFPPSPGLLISGLDTCRKARTLKKPRLVVPPSPMKKLPFCTLLGGALFAVAGTVLLIQIVPEPEPFPLFLPLMWDLIMVAIGAGIILKCNYARRAGMAWGIFCIVASLAIGAAAFGWLLPQPPEALTTERHVFMFVTVTFGVIYGIWQFMTLRSPAMQAWTSDKNEDAAPPHATAPRHSH